MQGRIQMDQTTDLRTLFHRLNNQLGIILSHAELLEAKSTDEMNRSRASQVIASVLDAMGTAKDIRFRTAEPASVSAPAAAEHQAASH
jgi:two-component sensor histidine kinase